jgi:ankyrin repeat protein
MTSSSPFVWKLPPSLSVSIEGYKPDISHIRQAARSGNIEFIKSLVKLQPELECNDIDSLCNAILSESIETVDFFLLMGTNPNKLTYYNMYPLHCAIQTNNIELVEKFANSELGYLQPYNTPLYEAVKRPEIDIAIVKCLYEKNEYSRLNVNNFELMLTAFYNGRADLVALLCDYRTCPSTINALLTYSVLDVAFEKYIHSKNEETLAMIKTIFKHWPSMIMYDVLALFRDMVNFNRLDILELLHEWRPTILHELAEIKSTTLDMAVILERFEIVGYLLENGFMNNISLSLLSAAGRVKSKLMSRMVVGLLISAQPTIIDDLINEINEGKHIHILNHIKHCVKPIVVGFDVFISETQDRLPNDILQIIKDAYLNLQINEYKLIKITDIHATKNLLQLMNLAKLSR